MKAIDLTSLKTPELLVIHNALAEKEVKGFKSTEAGQTAVTALLEDHSKGKDKKAKLIAATSRFPLAILTVLAVGIPLAKDLTVKVRPAHQRVLAKLHEAGASEKKIDKDKFAKGMGIKPDDAKYATALEGLYNLNLIGWEEDGGLTLTDVATNFVVANGESFDSTTEWDALEVEKPKATRASAATGDRKRVGDDNIITLARKENSKDPIDNPCNAAKERHKHFAAIKDGGTVKEYKDAGGNAFNLNFFALKGYVTITEPAAAEAK